MKINTLVTLIIFAFITSCNGQIFQEIPDGKLGKKRSLINQTKLLMLLEKKNETESTKQHSMDTILTFMETQTFIKLEL